MKLGKRLKQIEALVGPGYGHIWDCCCDHGLLGAALLARQAAPTIHFVDQIPAVMNKLQQKLEQFFPRLVCTSDAHESGSYENEGLQWQVHCMNLLEAPLELTHDTGKQLLIIAGVGGDLMTDLVESICARHPQLELDFLLCPVHHQYHLRQALIRLNCNLHQEILVEENGRFYEIIWVSTNPKRALPVSPVSPAGDQLWQSDSPDQYQIANQYLKNTLAHYQRVLRRSEDQVQEIIKCYQAVLLKAPQPSL